MKPDQHWYAVMCGGSAGLHEGWGVLPEFKAVKRMGEEGYEAFCPTVEKLNRPRRGQQMRETRSVPLWDGYCFARLDAWAINERFPRWAEVFDVIRVGGQPYPLSAAQIAALRELEAAFRYTVIKGKPSDLVRKILTGRLIAAKQQILRVGDLVEHRGSAFEALRGRIARVDRDKIEMIVDLLFGATRTVRVNADDVSLVV